MAKQKFLDLDDLIDNGKKVYVRNNALASHLLLVVNVKTKGGRNEMLKFPPTPIPICVTSRHSREDIRNSSDLRDMISRGLLVLVDQEEAEKVLSTPEAQEEMKSLSMSVYADAAPANAVRDNLARLKNNTAPVVNSAEVLKKSSLKQDDVQPRVKGIVSSLLSKEKSSKDTLTVLKRMKTALATSDLQFILTECRAEAQIREFAEAALAELSATPEKPFEE